MTYIINVDLETPNEYGGPANCESLGHRELGPHFDLTVHAIDSGCRNSRSVHRPPTRYWDDNDGNGYSTEEVKGLLQALEGANVETYSRLCGKCNVPPDVLV